MEQPTYPIQTLLITHSDRDGLLSGAALLRALGDTKDTEILVTQGSYLAFELEDLLASGRRYNAIYATDTYWHPRHAQRVVMALKALLVPGGQITWVDHHPSSVDGEVQIQRELPVSERTKIIGDRQGKFEAVSLVAESFNTLNDPVTQSFLKAISNGWLRNREPVPQCVQDWMAVVDGLARSPELPARIAGNVVRELAEGFDHPVPIELRVLGDRTQVIRARTSELLESREWPTLPSVDGGCGVLLDLREEPDVNAYELSYQLFRESERQIDYFVVEEHPGLVHYVSGNAARAERDAKERRGWPDLRVSTFHKGGRWGGTWRSGQGIDLAYLVRQFPNPLYLGPWINAHPYLIKAAWKPQIPLGIDLVRQTAEEIGQHMKCVLGRYGWSNIDRKFRR